MSGDTSIDTVNVSLDDTRAHLQRAAMNRRLVDIEAKLIENTALTQAAAVAAQQAVVTAANVSLKADASYALTVEILDYLRAGKAGLAVLKFLALIGSSVVAVITGYHFIFGGK